jgi:hypothetical protein
LKPEPQAIKDPCRESNGITLLQALNAGANSEREKSTPWILRMHR